MLSVICLLATTVSLTACWGVPAIDRQGLVSILAIDLADGGYRVTADVVNPAGIPSPAGAGQGSGQPVFIRSATGSTIADAVTNLSLSAQASIDLSHVQGVVVSEALARRGLQPLADYFSSATEVTSTAWLFVARGRSAASLVKQTTSVAPQPGIALLQTALFGQAQTASWTDRVESLEYRGSMVGDDFATSGVAVDASAGAGKLAGFKLEGVALFQGYRLTGWIDGPTLAGWLLLTGRMHAIRLTTLADERFVTLRVLSARRSVSVLRTYPGPTVRILTSVDARLVTVPDRTGMNMTQDGDRTRLESDVASSLLRYEVAALTASRHLHSDGLGLGQHLRVADPQFWQVHRAMWDVQGASAIPVHLSVRVRLRPGDAVCPPMQPCDVGAR